MTVATGASEQQVQELGASPWDSQHREFDYDLDDIEGAIPGGLRGALYRIGPGRLDVDGHPLSHIFDGDGMVSRIDIGPEGVHYRNRYVRTKSFARTNETRRPAKGFSTQRIGGSLANALRFPENLANTSVLLHDDVLYALWEGGTTAPARRRDPADLWARILRWCVEAPRSVLRASEDPPRDR
ncbi:carotenoid oxygenase family protein [Rhodococcus sp. Q1]|uniref:carotenoid oxygenase family protein n=1 Tax=Rhodococcus sp. Q1 TaxID=2508718 RepID=UPI001F5CA6B9|nr:carotenoid oxygenase family protein [Rhodococcus sp. Q1]